MLIPRKAFGALTLALCVAGLFLFSNSILQWSVYVFGSHAPLVPYTTHIVLLQFKETATSFAVKEITSRFFGLKKSCVHPDTRRPYVLSITGGKDTSSEGLQDGLSHAFILRFTSKDDRDYYVKDDPAHKAFKEAAAAVVEKTVVVDFQEGVFTSA
ncbi:stress responsive A/B barrel domain-containing protein [Didymella exigua CBS 183.55]|uniref:Stress responsive A/B barrel domain-containing protein n=1 Tax=Didymella exigua CBS 183.55 TaxID=1150837 RepID=A0A6A5RKM0_9PLEO|nr:stress responsive A/B barrel domain-containing protein [Didymella exigua CBS 183.55]KAF1926097.1 stress responsive A/B barrel domain-containing protein [Didymella exigua CBS 183.55]